MLPSTNLRRWVHGHSLVFVTHTPSHDQFLETSLRKLESSMNAVTLVFTSVLQPTVAVQDRAGEEWLSGQQRPHQAYFVFLYTG